MGNIGLNILTISKYSAKHNLSNGKTENTKRRISHYDFSLEGKVKRY